MDYAAVAKADNAKDRERHRNTWLQKNVSFDGQMRLPAEYRAMVERMLETLTGDCHGHKASQKLLDLDVLLANLLATKGNHPISISLDHNRWQPNRYNHLSYFVVTMVKLLHQKGLIHMAKGYHTKKESRYTRIWRTEALLQCFPELPTYVIFDPTELVILKDEKGHLMEYRDTAETYRIRKILKRANEVNLAADIRFGKYRLRGFLRAIFLHKFTLYGRLHTWGYRHYQGMPSEERQEITINGEPVVELDFSGLHPRLLYAAEGIQFDSDPYAIVHKDPRARPFLKTILLALINAQDFNKAQAGANHWLYKEATEEQRFQLHEIGITKAKPLMDAFIKAHAPISKYFCTGEGLRLMNKDGKIALAVIKSFADAGIPILAVHDSFVVQCQYRDRLETAMDEAYKRGTGGKKCGITMK